VVESQHTVVLRLDLERKITFVNDYGSRLRGVSRDAMIGTDVLDWVYPGDRETVRAALASELRRPIGRRSTAASTSGRDPLVRVGRHDDLDEHGTPAELQSVGFDVTERRAAADALRLRSRSSAERGEAPPSGAAAGRRPRRGAQALSASICTTGLPGVDRHRHPGGGARRRQEGGAGAATDELTRVSRYLGEVVEHLRLLAGELRPLLLHDLGLEQPALAGPRARERHDEHPDRLRDLRPRLAEALEVTVYRIAQEALTNALRHAQARSIRLELATRLGRLRLEVRDDGCGFDPSRRRTTALGSSAWKSGRWRSAGVSRSRRYRGRARRSRSSARSSSGAPAT
jgi:PAS domain-containing protein